MRSDGDKTGVKCPLQRCPGRVVYNGNYFCDTCDWAMPDHVRRDFLIECLAGLIENRRARGREDTSHEEFYLPKGHPLRTHDRGPEANS